MHRPSLVRMVTNYTIWQMWCGVLADPIRMSESRWCENDEIYDATGDSQVLASADRSHHDPSHTNPHTVHDHSEVTRHLLTKIRQIKESCLSHPFPLPTAPAPHKRSTAESSPKLPVLALRQQLDLA